MRFLLRFIFTIIMSPIVLLVVVAALPQPSSGVVLLTLFATPIALWLASGRIIKKRSNSNSVDLMQALSETNKPKEPRLEISVSTDKSHALPEGFANTQNSKRLQQDNSERSAQIDNQIQLVRLPTELVGIHATRGTYFNEVSCSDTKYEINLDEQTCTCPRFDGMHQFPKNHMGRICEHLFTEMDKQNAFARLHHLIFTALILGLREQTRAAYVLKQHDLPLMYVIVGESDEWLNIFARTKIGNQTIYEASGDFERHGWSIWQKRWSYGTGPAGASLLRKFLMAIDSIDDLADIAEDFSTLKSSETEQKKLSELSDPRYQTDENADQFGPENDAWEIPDSLLTDATPLSVSLNFRYLDSKNQKSRRTVDLKEIQFYGTEGEFIYGECRMRRAGRTFKTARMWDVIDVETGEIVSDVTEYLKNAYAESALGRLRTWVADHDRIARAWLYLLKANKTPTRAEYDVLKGAFSEILDGQTVTTKDIQNLFENATVTTPVGFQRMVSGIKKHHPEEAQKFAQVCHALVTCRKNPNFADEAALKFIVEKIPLN